MHIRKTSLTDNSQTALVFRMINKSLVHADLPQLDNLTFHFHDTTATHVEERNGTVILDQFHPFVREQNERGIRALLAFLLFELQMKSLHSDYPLFLNRLLANRKMIAAGFGDDLFYIYHDALHSPHLQLPITDSDILLFHLPWMSFLTDDPTYTDFLRKLCNEFSPFPTYGHWNDLIFFIPQDLTNPKNVKNLFVALQEFSR